MNNIDNSKLVLEMFNFKKGLTLEQEDIDRQITYHLGLFNCDETGKIHSQRNIIRSLSEGLRNFGYDNKVKTLLESLNGILKNDEMFYELDNLYRTLENSNQGMVYRHVMKLVLDIINETNAVNQQLKIINELSIHDWIPPVKNFIYKYTTDPRKRQNLSSNGGKADAVYSVVEKVESEGVKGFITFIGDKWFYITEKSIQPTIPSNFFKERDKLISLTLLQKALTIGIVEEGKITFKIDEDLNLGISTSDGKIFINNEKTDSSATLETIFDSALIPFMRRDLYPVISETIKNLNKFVDLDIVQKITNITNPHLECYVFNYKDNLYKYSIDDRSGNNFHEYESATILCNEMNQQLGYDLSSFLKNKFSDEVNMKKDLEGKEKFIIDKITDMNENIQKLLACGLIDKNEQIKMAYDVLISERKDLESDLYAVKSALANTTWKI